VGVLQSIKILNMIKLHGKPIRVNKSSQDKRSQEVGANLFIGNLDPDVDEKVPPPPPPPSPAPSSLSGGF
jgi:RNA recognition motif-containing protein